MKASENILFKALVTRDARYDGKLFFAVRTTGIFCRPVCPAPKPKPENVLYFSKATEAQDAGFRPCKRCRPETRQGSPAWQGSRTTIERALRLLAETGTQDSLPEISERLGVTDRHLRRLFRQYMGKTPAAIRTEHRLRLAVTLLTDRQISITDVAFSAGFGSLRRFNDAFHKTYGTNPSTWRRRNA